MDHRGFTHQELRDIFDLDPERPEDRPTIAALQASSTRRLAQPPARATQRTLRGVAKQLLGKQGWRTA